MIQVLREIEEWLGAEHTITWEEAVGPATEPYDSSVAEKKILDRVEFLILKAVQDAYRDAAEYVKSGGQDDPNENPADSAACLEDAIAYGPNVALALGLLRRGASIKLNRSTDAAG